MTEGEHAPETRRTVSDDPRPVNATLWGQWMKAGKKHWDRVQRSWSVFVLNTTELVDLLNTSATDIGVALQLMNPDPRVGRPFWDTLDQRLHNQVASTVTLVDHTRLLLKHYSVDVPTLVAEYEKRNARIMEMDEAAFLRDLRNYLLHYDVPPIVHSLSLGPKTSTGTTGHVVKLSAAALLERWKRWSPQSRRYLSSFSQRDGPVLGQDVAVYANALSELFTWLLNQRQVVSNDPNVLNRFRIG